MITYIKNKNRKSKKMSNTFKLLSIFLKSVDTLVNFATTSNSLTLSLIVIGLIVILVSTGVACGLTVGNEVIYEIVMQKMSKFL